MSGKNSINSLYCACLKVPSCFLQKRNYMHISGHWTKSKKSYTETIYFYVELVDITNITKQTEDLNHVIHITSVVQYQALNPSFFLFMSTCFIQA